MPTRRNAVKTSEKRDFFKRRKLNFYKMLPTNGKFDENR
jgi:hypothetical protein